MGRRKIGIEKIVDTNKRMVTFSKRRSGIMSKAAQLCKLFAHIVVCLIVFSPSGKAYTFSNSPLGVCDVVERFVKEQSNDKKQGNNNVHRSKTSRQCRNKAADVGSGSDSCWWDNIDIDELDSLEKLKSARESLANLKQNLLARKEKLTAAASSPLSSSSSTMEDSIIKDGSVEDDAATSIIEEHEERETSSKGHPDLDLNLNLYLGSQCYEKANTSLMYREAETKPRGNGRDLAEPCRCHPHADLVLNNLGF